MVKREREREREREYKPADIIRVCAACSIIERVDTVGGVPPW